ncbi:MAG TPA: protein phosphatase 2C domain-containing protein [Longimicrobiales bacterium]|nr:protein phosphatase 2C domain-containing protein [Longimicrobiales bacterium]
MTGGWRVAGGSVRGTRHRRAEGHNQDGLSWSAGEPLVLVVTDGCSSAERSEVGAALGSRIVARRARAACAWPGLDDAAAFARAVRDGLLTDLAPIYAALGGEPADLLDHLLFTAVVAVAERQRTVVLVMGDGVAAVNGELWVVDSPDNRPAYPAYGLLDPGSPPEPRVLWAGPTDAVRTLMVGSDGVRDLLAAGGAPLAGAGGALAALLDDARVFDNPDQLRRLLALANRESQRVDWQARRIHTERGGLPDDTTIVVARRGAEGHARP